jgi:hypothetical protein
MLIALGNWITGGDFKYINYMHSVGIMSFQSWVNITQIWEGNHQNLTENDWKNMVGRCNAATTHNCLFKWKISMMLFQKWFDLCWAHCNSDLFVPTYSILSRNICVNATIFCYYQWLLECDGDVLNSNTTTDYSHLTHVVDCYNIEMHSNIVSSQHSFLLFALLDKNTMVTSVTFFLNRQRTCSRNKTHEPSRHIATSMVRRTVAHDIDPLL